MGCFEPSLFRWIARISAVAMALLGCDDARDTPPPSALPSASSAVLPVLSDHVRVRQQRGAPQGMVRRATPPEAKVLISIESKFNTQADCLATAAVHLLGLAGYSAMNQWSHEVGVDLHLLASAHQVEGRTTITLENNDLYLALLLKHSRPSRVDVEELVAKLVDSSFFQSLARAPEHAGANSLVFPDVGADKVLAQCPDWPRESSP